MCATAVSKACELNGRSGRSGQNALSLVAEGRGSVRRSASRASTGERGAISTRRTTTESVLERRATSRGSCARSRHRGVKRKAARLSSSGPAGACGRDAQSPVTRGRKRESEVVTQRSTEGSLAQRRTRKTLVYTRRRWIAQESTAKVIVQPDGLVGPPARPPAAWDKCDEVEAVRA